MFKDCRGLPLTTGSQQAVIAFDHAVDGFLRYRADLTARLDTLLACDPGFGMANCLKGYLLMMSFSVEALPAARAASVNAWRDVAGATPREQAHAGALGAWVSGDPQRAASVWDRILEEHAHDILAFKLAHFVNFWIGRPEAMLASVRAVAPRWTPALPGYTALLGCSCFAHEELGYYLEAEAAGREAIRRDRTDLWAAHGVAHVLEMTGRRNEGIAWVNHLLPGWDGSNNLRHHLWWHQALYHLEQGDMAEVLSLYDGGFRHLGSPLTKLAPDLYIDVQNAASILYRLGRLGVDVADRWVELADKAEARIGDCLSAFTLPHWMMALVSTGRDAAAKAMLAAVRAYSNEPGSNPSLVRAIALPVTEAVLANGQGRHLDAVGLMRPVLDEMYRLGGSHAQQDVLHQVFLDSALKAGADADARMLLELVSGRHPLPVHRRRGYAMGAHILAA